MTDVTVKQFAEDVGAPVDRLLLQIKEAGLPARTEKDVVTDAEKQQLLAFLRRSHGESDSEPKKITLTRKTTTTITLKPAGSAGKQKTINVEVRKKRTYIKRADAPVDGTEAPQEEVQDAVEVADEAFVAEPANVSVAEVDVVAPVVVEAPGAAEIAAVVVPPTAEEIEAKKEREKEKEKKRRERGPDEEERPKGKEKTKSAGHARPVRPVPVVVRTDDEEVEERPARRIIRQKRKSKSERRALGLDRVSHPVVREVVIPETILVSDLAQRMSVKAGEVIKTLMTMGVMAGINQSIDQDTAVVVAETLGHKVKLFRADAIEESFLAAAQKDAAGDLQSRPPVVSVMGHVDHGKTSLLDYIRRTKVAAGESGGITQHIGAYHVETEKGVITFLDTPGHAAFTAMRARGAQCTDIVILVVAGDDGVMPQTREAIQHAKSAGVPLIVAINKMDKPEADLDRVMNELSVMEVISEDWGGDTQFVKVSAHTGMGIDDLLDAILLQAEVLELQAVPNATAKGVVIESSLDKGRGAVATVLVQNGTLRQGDIIIAGMQVGKVRAMTDENGKQVREAGPSIPVEILGLDSTPEAGDDFLVVSDERKARELAQFRQERERSQRLQRQQVANLENMFQNMGKDEKRTLNVVLKTDVRGSLEAIIKSLQDLGNDEVQVKIVSSGVGGLTETDASLALASSAVLIGFNVRADTTAKRIVESEGLDLRYYSVIYDIIDDVKAALVGMLAPEFREQIVGVADVREVFRSPKFGQVAGCMVVEGNIYRNKPIRVLRDNVVVFQGELESLRRFKDDVSEVRSGMECGIGVRGYDVKIGDKIEVFDRIRVERKLEG